ncbi:MAG: hypothetical protein H7287_04620 [Thermoleophilia bacterium]|nr:hypothetical protein [Thermoleophilia bacterium]
MTNLAEQLDLVLDGTSDSPTSFEVAALVTIADQLRTPAAETESDVEHALAASWSRIAAGLEARPAAQARRPEPTKRRASSSRRRTRVTGLRASALVFGLLLMTSTALASTNTRAGVALRSAANAVGDAFVSAVPGASQRHERTQSNEGSPTAVAASSITDAIDALTPTSGSEPAGSLANRPTHEARGPRSVHRAAQSGGETDADPGDASVADETAPTDDATPIDDGADSSDPQADEVDPPTLDPASDASNTDEAPVADDQAPADDGSDQTPAEVSPADEDPSVTTP